MDLPAVVISPAANWVQQSLSDQLPGTVNEQVALNGDSPNAPEVTHPHDTYDPGTNPDKNGETGIQYTTYRPGNNFAARVQVSAGMGRSDNSGTSANPELRGMPASTPGSMELTPEEKAEVRELQARDAAVRRHEQAHVMAGGQYIIRRAQFDYVIGPDGKLYAVGGEVQIDTSEVPDDPEATIQKAQAVRRAALAPSDPSPQDQRVAAEATRMEFEARMELARMRAEEARKQTEEYDQEGEMILPQTEPFLLNLVT
ncbi:putative metalloprotease CJM1_0395 family protein [Candidatus Neomarinimicrobiota bacterium]